MSRVGKKIIDLPAGVTVHQEGIETIVKGPKGVMKRSFHPEIKVTIEDNKIHVSRQSDDKLHRSLHGTTRAVLANMVTGVSDGFVRTLDLVGVGYRAQKQGDKLVLNVGYSHPVEFANINDVNIEVPSNTKIIIKGIDKEKVGSLAAEIRSVRPPEPYKGKGIRYEGEKIRRKEGKTGKK